MERIKPRTLSGFMELLPAQQQQMERVMDILRTTYSRYGFTPLDTPIIEASEILLAKGGGETEKQIYRFTKGDADLSAKNIRLHAGSVEYDAQADTEWGHVHVGIPALFTVYNTLDAMACCWNLGVPLAECADALAKNHGVKGRMEIIPTPGTGYTVLNDYAHKPDALEKVLQSAKAFAKGRVVALFGCGGDRDKTKRPVMGEIGARLADFVIVTSDNPRTEKPEAIIADILEGMKDTATPYVTIPDRVEAIHYAMDHAQPGDVIVLAGKGHEDYQEIDHKHYPMDERVIVAEYLNR